MVDSPNASPRQIVLLGSTGSIGTQAADIIRRNPGRFRVTGLAAGGGNPGLLAAQALEFGAEVVAVAREEAVEEVQTRCAPRRPAGNQGGRRVRCRRSWPAPVPWLRSRRGRAMWCSTG